MVLDMPLRILLADDHEIVRRGLRAVLEAEPGWEVTGEAANGLEAVEKAERDKPDVVLMDISMPELNGLEAARRIRRNLPAVEVLFLTMHESEQMIREAIDAGGRGFLLKADAGYELVPAVKTVTRHKHFFSPKIRAMGFSSAHGESLPNACEPRAHSGKLTSREREVVQLLAEGKSTKQVATSLRITLKTAATHRTNILRKLGLHSIAEIVRYAIRNGIVQA
ncbi:MAG TPA: response regulator transcription factor [Terriglobia bacterium]|nr:response regulator transcription factor [Terriglobia bacterium]